MNYDQHNENRNAQTNTDAHTEHPSLLLQRAVASRNAQARNSLQLAWTDQVHAWIAAHPLSTSSERYRERDVLTRASFAAFWQYATEEKVGTLLAKGRLLLYLKMCVHAVLADDERLQLMRDGNDSGDWPEQERVLVSLHYGQHLALSEVCQVRSDLFPTEEIARMIQVQVLQRLASGSSRDDAQPGQSNTL